MQDIADDFVENLAAFACGLSVHRGGTVLEVKDIQLALGACFAPVLHSCLLLLSCCAFLTSIAEKNWNMRLVGVGDNELKVIKKTTVTEAHKGRLNDVRRSKINHR